MAPLQARAVRCFSTGVSLDTPVHGCSHIVTLAPLERNYAISPIYYYYYYWPRLRILTSMYNMGG